MLRNMLSSKSSTVSHSSTTQTAGSLNAQNMGWKWEVNHDGVIWSWYHPSAPSAPLAPLAPSAPSAPSALVPTALTEKPTLVDYWYIVHDGVVIPNVNDW